MAENSPTPPSNELQATQLLGQIPLGAIIGSPLKAAVEAQSVAAMACYKFISQIGFEPSASTPADTSPPAEAATDVPTIKQGAVRTITFFYQKQQPPPVGAPAGTAPTNVTVSITVPLLTIMPLPFIRIESMTINFKASITASDNRSQSDESSSSKDAKADLALGFAWWKIDAGGSISSKKDSTATSTSKYSVEHTMDISVHAVQDDMPAGLAKILSILTDSITVSHA